jgi:hypothetical protein
MIAVFVLFVREPLNVSQWFNMEVAIPDGSTEDNGNAQDFVRVLDRSAT